MLGDLTMTGSVDTNHNDNSFLPILSKLWKNVHQIMKI